MVRDSTLPMINEVAEGQDKPGPLEMLGANNELVHFTAAKTPNQTYRFNMPKESAEGLSGNGYILAETALSNAISVS